VGSSVQAPHERAQIVVRSWFSRRQRELARAKRGGALFGRVRGRRPLSSGLTRLPPAALSRLCLHHRDHPSWAKTGRCRCCSQYRSLTCVAASTWLLKPRCHGELAARPDRLVLGRVQRCGGGRRCRGGPPIAAAVKAAMFFGCSRSCQKCGGAATVGRVSNWFPHRPASAVSLFTLLSFQCPLPSLPHPVRGPSVHGPPPCSCGPLP